ncbi:hypothetical protein [Longimicrobium terrae]|uniref:Uncharacterized protein n=1 Tax=Longimicrobium terrae TaxID=1639882 RepID=A0A841GXQ1_9BACT|nr:hypothetical protein [Longimicrobium terrae]MBB4636133.1 hypothetical protein [Longimicrobium terrae]MBB6070528.1 hypothetical protein [Longimicrobium terrae]NNC29517.1 hypothetical protein [Longimicrobium terrae]
MKTGAESALPLAEDRQTASVTPIRALPLDPDPQAVEQARLLRRLATDRLRELRDDGVTPGYIARMYGVELGMMEDTMQSLGLLAR